MDSSSHIGGLISAQVADARKKYGYNEVTEKEESDIARLGRKLFTPISLMMEGAMLLSAFAGKWEDFIIITALLGVNVTVDFLQETKANRALKAIQSTLARVAHVLRDGDFIDIPTRELVPNDIVALKAGDIVPADVQILEDVTLSVDQSTITGESLSVEKKQNDILPASAIIQNGSSLTQVSAIGTHSSIGKSISLVRKAEKDTSDFEKAIFTISRFLIVLALVLSAIVFTDLLLRGDPFPEIMRFVLVLIVASIPVALPTVLSVTMALGARKLAEHKAIVSNLRAIEALAGVDALCVDKTGTLTKNELAVSHAHTYNSFDERTLFVYALLASDDGYTTAVEHAAHTYAKDKDFIAAMDAYTRLEFTPFDPRTKITAALVRNASGSTKTITMGAPQIVAKTFTSPEEHTDFMHDVETLAQDGLKTIAVSVTNTDGTYPVGLIALLDPPRDDAARVIASIKRKGVRMRMITGDSSPIAVYVARMLALGTRLAKSARLKKTMQTQAHNDEDKLICDTDIFAEVTPEDKYIIVDALQRNGHLVAMTGDGVNDAPALKKANIGFAVSGATDAARSAADIVLVGKSLNVIDTAIGYARIIFARMESYATFRISETIRVIFFVTAALLIYNIAPISAIMIILLALLNDIPVMAIAYDNAPESETPIRWHMHETLTIATVLGVAGLVSSFILLHFLHMQGMSVALIQTILFVKLDVAGHSTLYLTRTGRKHFWEKPYPSLAFFLPAFSSRLIGTLLALFGVFMEQLSLGTIGFIWLYATVWFFINDFVKVYAYKLLDAYTAKKHLAQGTTPVYPCRV